MVSMNDVVNGIRQIQQDAMDAKATIVHHCDRADVLAVIIDRADQLASAIKKSRATASGPTSVDWVTGELREIIDLSAGTPGDDPLVALEKITPRVVSLLNAIEAPTLRHQLAELVTPRPSAPDYEQYPASVDDVAHEIAAFVDQMDTSGSANGLRTQVLEKLRAMETEHVRKHYEVLMDQILRTVTADHLHPALRAAGVPNPEGFRIELHGEWKP